MTWAHVTENGLIDWTSDVKQAGLIQLDLPVLEANERMRLVDGAVVVEREDAGEEADAAITRMTVELQEAQAQAAEQKAQEPPALTEEELQELPEEAREAYLAWQAGEAQAEAEPSSMSPIFLRGLLDTKTRMPPKLFPGRGFAKAHEFTGDFADWAFLNCEPDEKQKGFIKDYCRRRKFDALFLCCPYHGQRVSFADVLIGTDKVMLHKDVLEELQAQGVETSGLEFRAALFKGYCTAHCGVFLNGTLQKAIPDEAAATSLADAALALLGAGEETLAILKGGN